MVDGSRRGFRDATWRGPARFGVPPVEQLANIGAWMVTVVGAEVIHSAFENRC